MTEDDRASDVADWGDPPPLEPHAADRAADDPLSPLTEAGLLEMLGLAGRAQRSLLAILRADGVSPAVRQQARIALQAARDVSTQAQAILRPERRP